MLASVTSATLLGVDGQVVTVEVHVSSGLPAYHVVGLPDAAVRESRERVRAAVLSSELTWPSTRITVNLAPGGVRKTGAGLDLAVALGVLVATDVLPDAALEDVAVLGELGLDGVGSAAFPARWPSSRHLAARGDRARSSCPADNAAEAALVPTSSCTRRARSTSCARASRASSRGPTRAAAARPVPDEADDDDPLDLAEVRGLAWARRALEAAAAGGHHLLLSRTARRRQDDVGAPAGHDPPRR